ncbi:hypothetical protein [Nocardiopsis sp. CC223A]|uniref:hypothetical protein n=1 Tax=Nocardiopsis sp. CC223A TaxID=3044051 RepID=UPI00278C71D7|nr:hypothetical protein [Nocardiopsis sp. CC223A]
MKVLRPKSLVLDAGALRAAEADPHGQVWYLCREANAGGLQPVIPSIVLARIWRGGARQAGVARIVKACEVVGVDHSMALRLGTLLGVAGTRDVVDGVVVLLAMERNATVVTSDPGDIGKIADSVQGRVPTIVV